MVAAFVAKLLAIVAADHPLHSGVTMVIDMSDLCAHWDVHGNVQVCANDRVISTVEVLQRGTPQSLPAAADRVECMARDPAYRFAILPLVHGCVRFLGHARPPSA